MSEDRQPPATEGAPADGPILDPMPILGDLFNHFEAMVHATARVVARLAQSAPIDDDLQTRLNAFYKAHADYYAFKQKKIAEAKEEAAQQRLNLAPPTGDTSG